MGDAAPSAPMRVPDEHHHRRTALRDAGAWLLHPVSAAALAVMILNDHVLKAAFGTWWTGKLSDVAGLVFFPALVALGLALAAPRMTARSRTTAALTATGIGFAWVKLTTTGAATASAALSALVGPSIILRDPTDLLALTALPLAAWAARRQSGDGARWRIAVVAPIALLASVATSPAPAPKAVALTQVDDVWVLKVEDPPHGGSRAYLAWVDGTWVDWEPTGIEAEPLEPTRESCVPDDPDVCFRAVDDRLAVESTADGGATWAVDWEIADEDRAELADSYGIGNETRLSTEAVAVLPDGDGWVVAAANGRDGVAMRAHDGTWARVGHDDLH